MNSVREEELKARRADEAAAVAPRAMPRQLQLASMVGNQAFTAMVQDRKAKAAMPDDASEEITDSKLAREPTLDEAVPLDAKGAAAGATVKLAAVRNASTPTGMVDRIPPRVGTAVHVEVSGIKAGDPPVTLAVEGAGGGNGTLTIDGAATKDVNGTADVTLKGVDQTNAGKGGNLKLVAKQSGTTVASSAGFSVSAIPQNYNDVFARLITGAKRGVVVTDSWESDSGQVSDLNETQISEQVEVTSSSGCFSGTGKSNSGYLAGDSFSEDEHGTPVSILTRKGNRVAQQTCMFKDKRSGATDIPMTKSGYTVTRDVRELGGGAIEIQTTKVGAATTANSITSAAGSGSIDKTQAV